MAAAPGPWYRDHSWIDMTPAMKAQYATDAMLTPPNFRHVLDNQFSASGRFLGNGRNSIAGLWLRQDAANRVVQRLVIKKKKLHPMWLDHPVLHYAFHHVPNIPREIYCLKISRGQGSPRNVIGLDSSKKVRGQGEIREFREYAPFGTLNDLIIMHKRRKFYNRSGKMTRVENEPLQEAFLWCVFEGLANAVLGMANARVPPRWGYPVFDPLAMPGGQGGTEVVHNDIKLSKVLLGSPDLNIFPHYPQVKVTGFDFAYLTNPHDVTGRGNINPWLSLIEGHTPGFAPPELDSGNQNHPNFPYQLSFAQPGAPPGAQALVGPFIPVPPIIGGPHAAPASVSAQDPALSTRALSYSNVWQIGMVMRSLMRLEEEADVIANAIDYYATPRWGPPPAPGMPPVDSWEPLMVGIPPLYSPVLVQLVQWCLRIDPARRPSPHNPLTAIRGTMAPFVGNMRFAPANNRRSRNHLTRLNFKLDDYQVGDDAHGFPRPRPRR